MSAERVRKVAVTGKAVGGGTLHLDGQDFTNSVRDISVRLRPDYVPEVILDLLTYEIERLDVEDPQIIVDPRAHDLLIKLGWTAPEVTDGE